ncbi:MAG: TetR/AcrR family transcriptional regulator [Solirubrobacterales bacterium]|nr:TetR/AcrR family transcriptional regulator [Solirubrobacterales bacterium]
MAREPSKKRSREIVDAAARMFHERGYADTSVQDVAHAVGILKGSLYYYIDSKDDLLFRVLEDVHEDARHLLDDVAAMDAPPLERLAAYVRGHVEFNLRNLSKVAVYYHDFALLDPGRREVIIAQRQLYEELVIGLIADAQEAGEVDAGLDAHVAAYSALGMVNWVYTWYRPAGGRRASELAELIAEIVVGGLRAAHR